jgi:hypothetical protein
MHLNTGTVLVSSEAAALRVRLALRLTLAVDSMISHNTSSESGSDMAKHCLDQPNYRTIYAPAVT